MAGIYIHIPFCESKCSYCDFYSITNKSNISKLILVICKELEMQKHFFFGSSTIDTIYFGGGTPSLLKISQVKNILTSLKTHFRISDDPEITFEANPDDLSFDYLKGLLEIGINRLSIGIQSFQQDDLELMNRRHSALQASQAVHLAQTVGFDNISIDLIYGVPNLTNSKWIDNIQKAIQLNVNHISAYHLTYHNGTSLFAKLKSGTISELNEQDSILQFNTLIDKLEMDGFEHYEISNFAKNKMYSKHNSSYWNQTLYLGIGPSAHSYNGIERQWNVSNLNKYINCIENNIVCYDKEVLSIKSMINDYLITSLRTMWGINLLSYEAKFGVHNSVLLADKAKKFINNGHIDYTKNTLKLTRKGYLIADYIMSELMTE